MHINRFLFDQVLEELRRPEITILLGPRQVGKTYILKWLKARLDQRGVPSTFFNLENPEDLRKFSQPPREIYKLLMSSGKVIFIDEFHYLKNASQIFKAVFDEKKGVKIFASGSSSVEIHKHLKESLAGRRRLIQVPPLSFDELQRVFKSKTSDYYFMYGGLPGVIQEKTKNNRINLLSDLLQAYLLKDIKGLIKEENIRSFNMLLYLLAQTQGSIVNVENLSRDIGLSAPSIHKYLDILQHTYVAKSVASYSRNIGNELKKSKKYYFYDIGIRNALLKDFRIFNKREDKGFLLETAVFLHLSSTLKANEEIYSWRTRDGQKIDFILVKDRQPTPIEVKNSLGDPDVPNGIKSFIRRYPHTTRAYVLNNNNCIKKMRFQKTQIIYLPWNQYR